MRNGVYVHPRDLRELGERGGLAALAQLGFGDAALAVAYHAGRWLVPREGSLVRFLEDGIVHFHPRGDYGVLRPQPSREVPAEGASPLEELCAQAGGARVEAWAWTVLFHNSRLGRAHPGSCVHNAFGDAYEYALCPARPEVRAYGETLVRDVGRHAGLTAVELEAAGFMGWRHGSHHDKSSFTPSAATDFLLSYCFCDVCMAGVDAQGADADAIRARAQERLRATIVRGDAMVGPAAEDAHAHLADELGADALDAMLAHRRAVHRSFLRAARRALPDGVRLAVHLKPDALATGSQMGQPFGDVDDLVDEIVVTHYGEDPARIERAWQGRAADGRAAVRLAFWPKAPQLTHDDDVRRVATLARDKGCAGLRVYHLGLLPWRTIERVAAALGG